MLDKEIQKIIESVVGMDGREVIEKVDKVLVDYRTGPASGNAKCNNCKFYTEGTCSVVAGDIDSEDTCDVFQPASSDVTYDIVDFERFVKGLMNTDAMSLTVVGSILTPQGDLIVVEDGKGHRFSMYKNDLINITASWHGWTSAEVLDIEASGTN